MSKRYNETHIFSDKEAKLLGKLVYKFLHSEFPHVPKDYFKGSEQTVRIHPLAARFKKTREMRGLTIKEISSELKIPQYRLKAVEEGHFSEIRPDALQKYSKYLKLEEWLKKWIQSNEKLAKKMGIEIQKAK